jgi:hypothetical protein
MCPIENQYNFNRLKCVVLVVFNNISERSFTFSYELDPDPHNDFWLDPDPLKMCADPKHWLEYDINSLYLPAMPVLVSVHILG